MSLSEQPALSFTKTLPEDSGYAAFSELPLQLYGKDSQRFLLGHEPVKKHLEGCYVLKKNGTAVGRFAFYENPDLRWDNERTACIGSYECVADNEMSDILLNRAIQLTKQKGYTRLIGPMEGSTWNSYRFSAHNNDLNFFLEPYHHDYYNQQFEQAGFQCIAGYESRINRDISRFDWKLIETSESAFISQGLSFRNFNMERITEELTAIGEFCLKTFQGNFLFTPIEVPEFVNQYLKLKDRFEPEFIILAVNDLDEIQALVFGITDYCDPTGKTLIIKSLSRLRNGSYKNIGSFLVGKICHAAWKKGYKRAIHALMINDSISTGISGMYAGEPYKSYALYGMKV